MQLYTVLHPKLVRQMKRKGPKTFLKLCKNALCKCMHMPSANTYAYLGCPVMRTFVSFYVLGVPSNAYSVEIYSYIYIYMPLLMLFCVVE